MASLEQYLAWLIQNLKILKKKEFWVVFLLFIGIYGFINFAFVLISKAIFVTFNLVIVLIGLFIPTVIFAFDRLRQRKREKALPPPPPP